MEIVALAPRKPATAAQAPVLPDVIRSLEDMFSDKPVTFIQQNGHIPLPQVISV